MTKIDVHTKVKTKVYAGKLRARLAELKKRRPAELEKYRKDIALWKKAGNGCPRTRPRTIPLGSAGGAAP